MSSNTEEHEHQWTFDGDDPYVICKCGAIRDALTGKEILSDRVLANVAIAQRVDENHRATAALEAEGRIIKAVEQYVITLKAEYEEKIRESRRKGYQAGHQQGKTIHVNRPRTYRGTKVRYVIEDFIETLPAASKRCDCITCRTINQRIAKLNAPKKEL